MLCTFWVTVTLTSGHSYWSISPILFEVEFPNLVCGYIIGLQCRILFADHCDLDLCSRKIVS